MSFKFFFFTNIQRRFTRVLAQQVEKVIAVDFIEKFIEKNRELNKNSDNIDYVVGDVTKLSYNKHAYVKA